MLFQAAELSVDPRISVIPVRVSAKKKSLPRIKNSENFFLGVHPSVLLCVHSKVLSSTRVYITEVSAYYRPSYLLVLRPIRTIFQGEYDDTPKIARIQSGNFSKYDFRRS
jgi:hypothetical protein